MREILVSYSYFTTAQNLGWGRVILPPGQKPTGAKSIKDLEAALAEDDPDIESALIHNICTL